MKPFPNDLLVVDFEVTEFDVDKGEPVQVGMILLDKDTLETKRTYSSWIRPRVEVHVGLEGFVWSSFDEEEVRAVETAPSLSVVAEEVEKFLPDSYILCAWNATFDYNFMDKLLRPLGKRAKTARVLDLWSMALPHLLNNPAYKGDYRSESVFQFFGAEPREKHFGLQDCELEVMVLKKLLSAYSN